jgi:hypothetical protein
MTEVGNIRLRSEKLTCRERPHSPLMPADPATFCRTFVKRWIPACAGMSGVRCAARIVTLIQISNSQAKSPVFFAAPGTPSSRFVPRKQGVRGSRPPQTSEGMARREGASGSSIAHLPFGKMRRLSARHRGVLRCNGPRFRQPPAGRSTTLRTRPLFGRPCRQASNEPCGPPSASSWQEVLVPPGGAPSPPGSVACEATPAGAASCSTIKTPHDSALVEQDTRNISPRGAVGISFLSLREVVQAPAFFSARYAAASLRPHPEEAAQRPSRRMGSAHPISGLPEIGL